MVQMKYPVFIQALALTIVVFLIGMYSGVYMEQGRYTEMNEYSTQSEVSLMDILALNNLIGSEDIDCETLERVNFEFMDRVYNEAIILEEYEESGRVTENLKSFHKKYDVLRTFLWINTIETKKMCNSEYSTIVYLYNYEEEDLSKQATQNVWSKVLYEVKERNKNVLLIPIARDTDLGSLETLIADYNIGEFPAVIVNEKDVLLDSFTVEDIEKLL